MLKSIDEKDDEPLILTTNHLKTTNESLELDATQSDSTEENCYANLDPDKLVNAYGFGRYQMFGYFLCEFLNFFYSAALYVMPYVEANPVLECTYKNQSLNVDGTCWIAPKNNYSLKGKCGDVGETNLIVKDPHHSTTLIKEFGISCSSFVWKEAGLTAFTVGAIIVVPAMASMADEYGRRKITLASLAISFLGHLLASFAPNYYIFILLRFIIGAASDTYLSLCAIMSCELLPSGSRAWITLVQTIAWVFGMFWVGVLSLFVKEWRLMYMACAAPGALTIAYFFFLPESPHWLIQHEKYKEIEDYIRTSNRWNNTKIDVSVCRRIGPPPQEKRETIGAIIRSPEMLKLLTINGFIQFVMSFYYFGLSFLSVDLSDDRFTAFMLSAFVELPGGLVVIPLMLYAGRRILCLTTMVVQGVAIIIAPFSREPEWCLVAFVLFGKMINSVTYAVHPIYVSELSPTSVRSLFFSIINVPQSIGIIVAPYLRHLDIGPEYTKYVAVGVLCIISGLLCVFLPETKDRPLPPDIKTASDNFTADWRDREELMREQELEEHEYPDEKTPAVFRESHSTPIFRS
ncbi:hypothetical protein RB195_015541 [Necator americanus]|uniref:Major facilitator superfamily (MFS) profile domain-containing protein n=1 Tax=Necator americanus TaxID=51031 RepID=A0ABR1E582_NECAM